MSRTRRGRLRASREHSESSQAEYLKAHMNGQDAPGPPVPNRADRRKAAREKRGRS